MIQKTEYLKNRKAIQDFAGELTGSREYEKAACRLLLVWYELWDGEKVKRFAGKLARLFPDAHISATCFHDRSNILTIPYEMPKEGGFLVSAMLFESSDVCLISVDENEEVPGTGLNEKIRSLSDVRGVYINPNRYEIPFDALLENASRGVSDVQFFGMKATVGPGYSNFFVSPGDNPVFNTLHAVIFSGADLHIKAGYNLGWTPMGREMKVTNMSSPTVVTHIDGMSATSVYTKYLGISKEQINSWNVCDFPLVREKNGIIKACIGMSNPEGEELSFGIPMKEGDIIRLSYGNPDEILKCIRKDAGKVRAFNPQGLLLFICVNRLILLKDDEHKETDHYTANFKDGAAVYGFAELHSNRKGAGEYNSALISAAFREGEGVLDSGAADDNREEDRSFWSIVPSHYKLFHFFTAMSQDLIHAAEAAQKANKAKTEFLSSVSHEIRTPINAILGMDEMILREAEEEDVRRYARNIEDSGKLLLGLINDLLDTARIESGKMEIIPVNYDLASTLNDIVNIVSPKAQSKGLKLLVNVNPEIPHLLKGDETRVKQCTINILNNAVKYTQTGSVRLEVDFKKHGESSVDLLISVADTGIGIKKKDLEKLNRPFERLDQKKNYGVEGTGLGLSIVNSFLKLMDSHLDVKSEYGKGSVFSFAVKQDVTDWEAMGDYGSRQRLDVPKEAYHESFRAPSASILVADDTEMNLIVITSLLKDTQIRIDTVPGGEEALTMAKMKKYDIIFIDQQMPGMKGDEVLKKLRRLDSPNKDTICVILTADAVAGAREKYLKQGFDDYISKPVSGPSLERLIMKLLPKEKLLEPGEKKKTKDTAAGTRKKFMSLLGKTEEIDLDAALANAGNEETLIHITESFVRTGSENLKLLEKLLDDRNIEDFTVRVHAVKSSAKIMGDDDLSKKALNLEELGNKKDLKGIRAAFDDFMSDYETLVGKLHECEKILEDKKDSDLPPLSDEDLSDYLHRMTILIEEFEYDEALMTAGMLLDHDLRNRREDIEKIKEALEDFDGEKASRLIKELR
ncbi:MAG: response regulator [Lachnospiraceae bacterium]|nr:response regulator [Lachnospiraceae bacterium]